MGSIENASKPRKENPKFELPAGFRFHPTDEELINQYLTKKVVDNCFCAIAIGEVDLNKCEPWDLPGESLILTFILMNESLCYLCFDGELVISLTIIYVWFLKGWLKWVKLSGIFSV